MAERAPDRDTQRETNIRLLVYIIAYNALPVKGFVKKFGFKSIGGLWQGQPHVAIWTSPYPRRLTAAPPSPLAPRKRGV